jgi:dolichol-phosphate mannosyltransferase
VTVSIVVPVFNEEENLESLIGEIHQALSGREQFEIVYVDDGSKDQTPQLLQQLKQKFPELRSVRHKKSCGQSAAIRTGVVHAKGSIIVTLDGDGQNDPADIPALLSIYRAPTRDKNLRMVAGQRVKRQDTVVKKLTSKFGNAVRQFFLRDGIRDTGCSLKAFDREVFLQLPYFDHMHRYLPALIQREGFTVATVDVSHRPRTRGVSKYGFFDRLWVSLSDLFGVVWLKNRRRLPEIEV